MSGGGGQGICMLSAGRRWCQVGGRHDTQHTCNWDSQNKTLGPINKITKAPSWPVHHNHSPKSVVGRQGLTLKFNNIWDAANMCTVPRGNFNILFKYSSLGELQITRILCRPTSDFWRVIMTHNHSLKSVVGRKFYFVISSFQPYQS